MRSKFIRFMRRGAAAVGTAVGLAGCGSLLDQAAPSRVLEETLQGPASAKLIVDGARASFGCVLQAYVTGMGLLTDELEDTQLGAAGWDWDRRSMLKVGGNFATAGCDQAQQFGIYTALQTARYTADLAVKNLATFTDAEVPGRVALLADTHKSGDEIASELYRVVFGRDPVPDETALVNELLLAEGAVRRPVIEDLVWAMMNSAEFVFQD